MMRADSFFASASCARYSRELGLGLRLRVVGVLELLRMRSVRSSMPFLMPGQANFHSRTNSTTNEIAPQISSLFAGMIGLGAFWQSSIDPPSSSFSMHSSSASPVGSRGWRGGRATLQPARAKTPSAGDEDGDEQLAGAH